MSRYIIRRLLVMIPMLFGISVVTYIIADRAPGDVTAIMFMDPDMHTDPAAVARVREQLGLDQPLHVRYFRWLSQVVQGNFGYSYVSRQPILSEISSRIGPTIRLTMSALVLSSLLGIGIGVFCARRQYKLSDYVMSIVALLGMSIPNFFFAILLILLFTLTLDWLPSMGLRTVGLTGTTFELFWDQVRHMVMPVLALSLSGMGMWMRFQRASFLEVMNQDYIRTARSKGLREDTITWRHAFKNASIPIVTMLGSSFPALIGGAFVIENVFGLPGMGSYGVNSILRRDYPAVMAVVFFSSIMVMVGILISDLLYAVVDPRVKYVADV